MIDYSRHRKAIERLYEDCCDVYRHEKVKDPITKESKLTLKDIDLKQPCKLSQKSLGVNGQTEAQNNIKYEMKLFCAPELEIRQGDLIEVLHTGVTRRYEAGEPFLYSSHQEVILQRKDWA